MLSRENLKSWELDTAEKMKIEIRLVTKSIKNSRVLSFTHILLIVYKRKAAVCFFTPVNKQKNSRTQATIKASQAAWQPSALTGRPIALRP